MRYSEAEQCFFEDVREKKKAASGVHSKTGKNGYTGKILFPTDIMSRKEKYNHRKAGRVMTTNMYENILPIAEFEALEDYEKRNRLQFLRGTKSAKEIQSAMGVNSKRYYEIVAELGLPKAPRTKTGDVKVKRTAKTKTTTEGTKTAAIAIQSSLDLEPEPVQEIIVNGLHLTFNGTYTSEHIIKQFLKYGALLEGEEDQYYIELKLVQKQN
jgi:hypothetical protein